MKFQFNGWVSPCPDGAETRKQKNPPGRRVVGANQHHAEINSIAAGTKQEQN
jgi:hypothetical protein